MSWHSKIERFIRSADQKLPIGARSLVWVNSLERDIQKRWRLPVYLSCVGATDTKNVFLYELRKTKPGGGDE
jgi:hypothetical protein